MRLLEDAFPRPGRDILRWYAVVAVCLAYASLASVVIWSYSIMSDVPMPFLAAGVYWGGLLLTGVREWRFIVPSVFAIQLGLDLGIYNASLSEALIFSLSKTLEGLAGVAFLRFGPPLRARRFTNRVGRFLVVGGAVAPVVFALTPAIAREEVASAAFYAHWLQWALVQGSGIVLVAPLMLSIWLLATHPGLLTRRLWEIAALAFLAFAMFALPILEPSLQHPATLFMAMPLLFVIAGRFGLLGAVSGNTLLGAAAIGIVGVGVYDFPNLGTHSETVASLCVFLLANAGASLFIGASATDRENSVFAAESTRGLLRDLAVAAQEAEDDYRKEIAEVLHDDLGQNLALIRMRLDILLHRVDGSTEHALLEIRDAVDATIMSGRSITTGVASSIFKGGDLGDALEQLLYTFEGELGIGTELKREGELNIDGRLSAKLFRCSREMLLNVLKHANAKRVSVEISEESGELRIIVSDDGDGFDPKALRQNERRTHYGLSSCQNTLESLGGSLELISSPGRGTTAIMTARRQH